MKKALVIAVAVLLLAGAATVFGYQARAVPSAQDCEGWGNDTASGSKPRDNCCIQSSGRNSPPVRSRAMRRHFTSLPRNRRTASHRMRPSISMVT